MLDRIEKMRKKSYDERKRITLLVSVCFTVLIGLVWGTAILPRTFTLNEENDTRADAVTPFKTLSEDMGLIWGDLRRGIDELGEGLGELWTENGESVSSEEVFLETSPRGDTGTDDSSSHEDSLLVPRDEHSEPQPGFGI